MTNDFSLPSSFDILSLLIFFTSPCLVNNGQRTPQLRFEYLTVLLNTVIAPLGMAFNMGEDVCERMGCDWASPFESTISQQKVTDSLHPAAPACAHSP